MSDPVSAPNGVKFKGAIEVSDAGLRGMITLRGDLGSVDFRNAATGATGVDFPGERGIFIKGDKGLAWMSPDELLVMVPYANVAAALETIGKSLAGQHHLAVDVSDARAVFCLKGKGAREVLAKGAPVDLSSEAFDPGMIRRTRIGQIAAAFWMTDSQTFELVCFRSVAGFMFDWLSVSASDNSLPGYL